MSWLDRISGRVIRDAAARAPTALQERLEEEWLADFAERRSAIARLRLAIGCYWATNIITHEHAATALAAAGGVPGRSLAAYRQRDFQFLTRRTTVIALILGAHVLVFFALVTGLVPKGLMPEPPRTVVDFSTLQPQTPDVQPESPLPPTATSPRIPEPYLDPVVDSSPEASQSDADPVPAAIPPNLPPSPASVARVLGGPGNGFPNAEKFYPAAARRLGETGATILNVCVNAAGQLSTEPQVTQSSGSSRLDGGALRLAMAGSGRYRATTENGRAISSCFPMRVRFELR
jgi:TonB family protein